MSLMAVGAPFEVQITDVRFTELVHLVKDMDRRISEAKWVIGDAALEIAPMGDEPAHHNGSTALLELFANEVQISVERLKQYREVASAFPDEGTRVAATWSVYRELRYHPNLLLPFKIDADEAEQRFTVAYVRERLNAWRAVVAEGAYLAEGARRAGRRAAVTDDPADRPEHIEPSRLLGFGTSHLVPEGVRVGQIGSIWNLIEVDPYAHLMREIDERATRLNQVERDELLRKLAIVQENIEARLAAIRQALS